MFQWPSYLLNFGERKKFYWELKEIITGLSKVKRESKLRCFSCFSENRVVFVILTSIKFSIRN